MTNEELLKKYSPIVKKLAFKIGGKMADDLISIGEMAIINAYNTFDASKKTTLYSYIYGKVKSAMKDEFRKLLWFKRKNNEITMIPFDELKNMELQDYEDLILNNEETAILKEHINKLPEREKRILQLIFWNGMTFFEIGNNLNISESRVAQLYKKAIKTLRTYVK